MRTPRRLVGTASATLLAVSFLLSTAPTVAAAIRMVSTTGTDAGTCLITPCRTLQYAINQAFPGDTIDVAAGTYTVAGLVSVNKTVRIVGEQAGIDACGRTGSESVLSNSQGMSVSASGVEIDGLAIQDSSVAAYTGYGLWLNPGVSGTVVVNSIFRDNIAGIGLANAGPAPALIRDNAFLHNNRPGGASGTGIYTDQYVGGAVSNVVIDSNCFIDNENAGVGFSNVDTTQPGSNIELSNNFLDQNGRGFYFYNTDDVRIHDNRITNSTDPTDGGTSVAIAAFGDVDRMTILSNDLLNGQLRGIRIGAYLETPNSGIEIHRNNIVGFVRAGLEVHAGGHVGPVPAQCNWWGSATGPTNPGNPGGTGDTVIGDAIFQPWLIAPAPGGACAGAPNTSGKVTGGGQIESSPLFSLTGTLLTAPAVVPSAANPRAQASFGFVAECCDPRGNLEYNDKPADVRIKVLEITGFSLSGGDCGPGTHATFTGTASVIRSIGTTTESFAVDVDDCGEPGTLDTFGISVASYSNGPSILISGNIQIHRS